MEASLTITMYDLAGADIGMRFSPFCWRTRFALAHKQLQFRTVAWRFTDKELIRPFNSERVPVIIDHGIAVHDSWRIAEHLEEAYPHRPPLFDGATGFALARMIANWTDLTLHPLIARWKIGEIFRAVDEKDREYFRSSREVRFGATLEQLEAKSVEAMKAFEQALGCLRATLERQPFISGKVPLYPDYVVCAAFQWITILNPRDYCDNQDPIARWRLGVLAEYRRNLEASSIVAA